ncbi:hypothetical protein CONLIGDRAFT_96095 [Coniochaeta ligniaria NRRL 30616]|uniref:Peroxin 20 n=1 Tax=Coniochaeta ligniaria NRRL 30616 TaxID=1408157 RepID=A0A1J7IAB3_9PEZI|nr:hypothetical protein CONLIGDRAFT_96095 [Coniochaeta ligniaria NRRL 30616]
MADDMCGPSNGAKNFLSHADRDRSLHQDRVTGAPNGGNQSFRNQLPTTNGDAAFQSFLSAPGGPQAGSPMPGMVDDFRNLHLGQQGNRTMDVVTQARAANAGMSVEQYNSFLQGMGGQPGVAHSSTAAPFHQTGGPLVNPQTVMAPPVARVANLTGSAARWAANADFLPATGNFMRSGFPITHSMSPPIMQQGSFFAATNALGFDQAAPTNVQGAQANPALAAAFDSEFAQYDDGEFQHELDNWMAEHGQTAERAQQQRPAEPTMEEWAEIEANMERIADAADAAYIAERDAALQPAEDQEAAREEDNKPEIQQELIRAATNILTSVANNASEKFKNSNFLELMRRIRDEEVTVVDNTLVDAETGAEIIGNPTQNGGEASGSQGVSQSNVVGGEGSDAQRLGKSSQSNHSIVNIDSILSGCRWGQRDRH